MSSREVVRGMKLGYEAAGRALRDFIDRVAERGGEAVTEKEDLVVLRMLWILVDAALRAAERRR